MSIQEAHSEMEAAGLEDRLVMPMGGGAHHVKGEIQGITLKLTKPTLDEAVALICRLARTVAEFHAVPTWTVLSI